jgi:methyl-accepting chemotaxis protein
MTASINSIARIASENSDSTHRLIETVDSGRQKASISNSEIKEISTDVNNMMAIIGVINRIASQTNLLAMNAAIEAAHAGEYGRGFSVVADEIRKLAESTSTNAKVISESLKNSVGKMNSVLAAGVESENAFRNVSEEVNKFVKAFSEISQSTNEVSEGNVEVLKAIASLRQISQDISNGSDEINTSAVEINESVNTIKDSSANVVSSVETVKGSVRDISTVQESIVEAVDWNTENIGKIENSVNYFKLPEGMDVSDELKTKKDVTNIIVHHQKWIIRASEALDGNNTLDVEKASNYKSCRLGTWLYGEGKSYFRDDAAYESIVESHQNFHLSVAKLAESLEQGNRQEALDMFFQIRKSFQNIIRELRQLLV